MSRLGKKPIVIPEKTVVTVSDGRISVKGPLGELSRVFRPIISVAVDAKTVTLTPKHLTNESRALWGTYASLLRGMMQGVNKAFQKKLIIEGIGYKADAKGQELTLALGFSHPVKVTVPAGLKVTTEKGAITIAGIDKELVGRFASEIRAMKKPEPYKGKGIRYETEVIRRKQGKKAAATATA